MSRMTAPEGTGRFEATNVPVRMLILNAYGIPGFQLVGGPSWVDSLRVDVLGRGAANATRAEISAMVRTLLAERFNLVVRRDRREMPVFALVVARAERRLGPRMQSSTTDCSAAAAPGAPAPQTACGQLLCTTRMSPFTINAGGMTMARLAQTLSGIVDRFSGHKVVTLQLADAQSLEDLGQYGQVLEVRSPKVKLKIPRGEVPKALAAILARHTVEDVVVEDPPLEAVIAEVFTQAAQEEAAEESAAQVAAAAEK